MSGLIVTVVSFLVLTILVVPNLEALAQKYGLNQILSRCLERLMASRLARFASRPLVRAVAWMALGAIAALWVESRSLDLQDLRRQHFPTEIYSEIQALRTKFLVTDRQLWDLQYSVPVALGEVAASHEPQNENAKRLRSKLSDDTAAAFACFNNAFKEDWTNAPTNNLPCNRLQSDYDLQDRLVRYYRSYQAMKSFLLSAEVGVNQGPNLNHWKEADERFIQALKKLAPLCGDYHRRLLNNIGWKTVTSYAEEQE